MVVEIPIERYEENRRFVSTDKKPHVEGVLLFSEGNNCYGVPLDQIVSEQTENISSCPQALQVDPHADALDQLKQSTESRTFLLSKSHK